MEKKKLKKKSSKKSSESSASSESSTDEKKKSHKKLNSEEAQSPEDDKKKSKNLRNSSLQKKGRETSEASIIPHATVDTVAKQIEDTKIVHETKSAPTLPLSDQTPKSEIKETPLKNSTTNPLTQSKKSYEDNSLYLSNIKIEQHLGKGNFGDVYLGKWTGIPVALKSFKTEDMDTIEKEIQAFKYLSTFLTRS